jgi:hypothetical protein
VTKGGTKTKEVVWIGVAGVIPKEGCELISADKGAYTNFLTLAANEAEYRSKVADVLGYYNLELLQLSDIRPFSEADDPNDEILQIAREIQEQQNLKHVRYATFYTFPRTM